MNSYTHLADKDIIDETSKALTAHGFAVEVVENGEQAKERVLALLPAGAEVFTNTSTTTQEIGLVDAINNSDKYASVRKMLNELERDNDDKLMRQIGAAPDYAVGSVHAVSKDGRLYIASGSGSQLPAYSYAAKQVILVVGTHKIVKDQEAAFKRIYEHSLPLESERARKAYGVPGSNVNKLLIMNADTPGRTTVVFVKEVLGF